MTSTLTAIFPAPEKRDELDKPRAWGADESVSPLVCIHQAHPMELASHWQAVSKTNPHRVLAAGVSGRQESRKANGPGTVVGGRCRVFLSIEIKKSEGEMRAGSGDSVALPCG